MQSKPKFTKRLIDLKELIEWQGRHRRRLNNALIAIVASAIILIFFRNPITWMLLSASVAALLTEQRGCFADDTMYKIYRFAPKGARWLNTHNIAEDAYHTDEDTS